MSPPDEPAEDFEEVLHETLSDLSSPDRTPIFVALLNERLPEDSHVVLVGGGLVELLSDGMYTTGDVDLVGGGDHVGGLLEGAGFKSEGRHYVHPDLGLAVDLVGPRLEQDQSEIVIEYKGYKVPALTIEDLIVDRLNAAKHWDSETDWEQAVLIYEVHRDRLDRERLEEKAAYNDVQDVLKELEESIQDAA